jgi:hypothetical protein
MRKDMAKVIVERPRIRPFNTRKGRRQALEHMPVREGMRRAAAARGERKELNENLAPLRRYLERQVGRPWDKVYSEIAEHLRADNAVQQHVRDHLKDFVAVKPRRINAGWRTIGRSLWYQPLYVDPVTGILRRTGQHPEEKRRRRRDRQLEPAPIERIALSDDHELRRLRGLWYEVQFAALPGPEYRSSREVQKRPLKPYDQKSPAVEVEVTVRRLITPPVYDVMAKTMVEVGPAVDDETSWRAWRRIHPDSRYAIAKRLLSRRELRHHGLSNIFQDPS